jgi:hypothetical protein
MLAGGNHSPEQHDGVGQPRRIAQQEVKQPPSGQGGDQDQDWYTEIYFYHTFFFSTTDLTDSTGYFTTTNFTIFFLPRI